MWHWFLFPQTRFISTFLNNFDRSHDVYPSSGTPGRFYFVTDEREAISYPPAGCWLDTVIDDFNGFNRTENSCCICTSSDGGVGVNDLSMLIRLVFVPSRKMISLHSRTDGACPFCALCTHLVLHFLHPLSIWPPLFFFVVFFFPSSLMLCLLVKCALMLSAMFSFVCELSQTNLREQQRIHSPGSSEAPSQMGASPVEQEPRDDAAVCTARRFYRFHSLLSSHIPIRPVSIRVKELFWWFEELEELDVDICIADMANIISGCYWILDGCVSLHRLKMSTVHLPQSLYKWKTIGPEVVHQHKEPL